MTRLDEGRDTVAWLLSAEGGECVTRVGDGEERELAEGLVVTGTSDGVDEKLAEVLCETWEGGGMAVKELDNSCQEDLVQPSCEM